MFSLIDIYSPILQLSFNHLTSWQVICNSCFRKDLRWRTGRTYYSLGFGEYKHVVGADIQQTGSKNKFSWECTFSELLTFTYIIKFNEKICMRWALIEVLIKIVNSDTWQKRKIIIFHNSECQFSQLEYKISESEILQIRPMAQNMYAVLDFKCGIAIFKKFL